MEGFCCSMSSGTAACRIRPPFDCWRGSDASSMRNPLFGGVPSYWSRIGTETSPTKVRVASDYSDSLPNSSNFMGPRGYHPLEEVKDTEKRREKMLTEAEIARTTVEANNSALLVFPGRVHCEPHGHISWTEFEYIIDDFGDIFFEIYDDENILQDRGASNPVNVLIGMDLPIYNNIGRATDSDIDRLDQGNNASISFYDDEEEIGALEVSSTSINWGMPETMRHVHPMYFAKRVSRVVNTRYWKKMDRPSNALSIVGCIRPALIDEESYLRRLFYGEDSDEYMSDWKDAGELEKKEKQMADAHSLNDEDDEMMKFGATYGSSQSSTLYKLDIVKIELFSVYGDQSLVSLQDFQNAEPDILVHSASVIIEHFSAKRMKSDAALKALCRKKKGLNVEGAVLIGVDSLGMDVRAFTGLEATTIRFSFNARATSESSAEKKIQRMLFPRYYRKNFKASSDGLRDSECF